MAIAVHLPSSSLPRGPQPKNRCCLCQTFLHVSWQPNIPKNLQKSSLQHQFESTTAETIFHDESPPLLRCCVPWRAFRRRGFEQASPATAREECAVTFIAPPRPPPPPFSKCSWLQKHAWVKVPLRVRVGSLSSLIETKLENLMASLVGVRVYST